MDGEGGEVQRPDWLRREKRRLSQRGFARVVGQAQGVEQPATGARLDQRPLAIIHKEQRLLQRLQRWLRGRAYQKEVNEAVGGNS